MKVLALLHQGFEEIEGTIPLSFLSYSNIETTIVSTSDDYDVIGSRGIEFTTKYLLKDVNPENFDCVFLPGGPGIIKLRENEIILNIMRNFHSKNKIIAAICAAPLILQDAGILNGYQYTCHTSIGHHLPERINQPVVTDRNLITGCGPGAALNFAYSLVSKLLSEEKAKEIASKYQFVPQFFDL